MGCVFWFLKGVFGGIKMEKSFEIKPRERSVDQKAPLRDFCDRISTQVWRTSGKELYVGESYFMGFNLSNDPVSRPYFFLAEARDGVLDRTKRIFVGPVNKATCGVFPMLAGTFFGGDCPTFYFNVPGEIMRVQQMGASENVSADLLDPHYSDIVRAELERFSRENPGLDVRLNV